MANSKRKRIIEFVRDTTLPLILTANGYTQNIKTIERGIRNVKNMTGDEFHAIFMPGANEARADKDRIHFLSDMSIFLACFVQDPDGGIGGVQELLDNIIEDVTKACYSDETLGGLSLNTTVSEVDPEGADDGTTGFVLLKVDVQYESLKATP